MGKTDIVKSEIERSSDRSGFAVHRPEELYNIFFKEEGNTFRVDKGSYSRFMEPTKLADGFTDEQLQEFLGRYRVLSNIGFNSLLTYWLDRTYYIPTETTPVEVKNFGLILIDDAVRNFINVVSHIPSSHDRDVLRIGRSILGLFLYHNNGNEWKNPKIGALGVETSRDAFSNIQSKSFWEHFDEELGPMLAKLYWHLAERFLFAPKENIPQDIRYTAIDTLAKTSFALAYLPEEQQSQIIEYFLDHVNEIGIDLFGAFITGASYRHPKGWKDFGRQVILKFGNKISPELRPLILDGMNLALVGQTFSQKDSLPNYNLALTVEELDMEKLKKFIQDRYDELSILATTTDHRAHAPFTYVLSLLAKVLDDRVLLPWDNPPADSKEGELRLMIVDSFFKEEYFQAWDKDIRAAWAQTIGPLIARRLKYVPDDRSKRREYIRLLREIDEENFRDAIVALGEPIYNLENVGNLFKPLHTRAIEVAKRGDTETLESVFKEIAQELDNASYYYKNATSDLFNRGSIGHRFIRRIRLIFFLNDLREDEYRKLWSEIVGPSIINLLFTLPDSLHLLKDEVPFYRCIKDFAMYRNKGLGRFVASLILEVFRKFRLSSYVDWLTWFTAEEFKEYLGEQEFEELQRLVYKRFKDIGSIKWNPYSALDKDVFERSYAKFIKRVFGVPPDEFVAELEG